MSEMEDRSMVVGRAASFLSGGSPEGKAFMRQLQQAVPRTIGAERLARICLTEVRMKPQLVTECSWESFLGAVMQSAQLGLEPGIQGQCWLIPRGGHVNLQVGYRGLLKLIWQSELISSVQSEVVYDCDEFQFAYGIPPTLRHVPANERPPDACPTHCYAILGTKAGGWLFRVMSIEELEAHRDRFSKATRGPWVTDFDEMCTKTLLLRVCKRAPISTEAMTATTLADQADLGIAQEIPHVELKIEQEDEGNGTVGDGAESVSGDRSKRDS